VKSPGAPSGNRGTPSGRLRPGAAPPAPDPSEPPAIAMAQIRAALERRHGRRREVIAELRAALGALAEAVEHHTVKVDDVRRAVEAQGGDLAPLQFYDSIMARFRLELRAAERTLADVYRVAAEGSAARS
jgi:hypothetical protein